MIHIGYHESISGGLLQLGKEALSVGGNTFAFFTRNPRGGKAKDIDKDDALNLVAFMKENHFASAVAHAPYTMNPCSSDEGLRTYALNMMIDDFMRLESIPGSFYNFHPGSHTGQGVEKGIDFTSSMICNALKEVDKKLKTTSSTARACSTTLLIETMAGKGSEIGRTFEEIETIINLTEQKYGESLVGRLGVCLDTCHVWDAGYDIVGALDNVLLDFDKVIGIKRLCAVHLNDSMNEKGSHKDRHEKLGKGKIGLEALRRVTKHALLKDLPFILETPNDRLGYIKEIEMIKE